MNLDYSVKQRAKKRWLTTLSATLILCATIGFGIAPILESRGVAHVQSADQAQRKYYELRRNMDLGALQWELARIFLVTGDLLSGASTQVLSRNQSHYHYSILNAWTFASNAAHGYDETGKYEGMSGLHLRPARSDEEIRQGYQDLVIEANERNTRLLAERSRHMALSQDWFLAKSVVHASCLVLNSFALLLGLWIMRYE
jgi:hypothetical protein